jgi:hypothetical protein
MESYKLLSPDFEQCGHGIAHASNLATRQHLNTLPELVIVQSNVLFKLTASAIWVYDRGHVSLPVTVFLSLTHALSLPCQYSGFTQHNVARHEYVHILQGIEGPDVQTASPHSSDVQPSSFFFFIGVSSNSSYCINIQDCGLLRPRPRTVTEQYVHRLKK